MCVIFIHYILIILILLLVIKLNSMLNLIVTGNSHLAREMHLKRTRIPIPAAANQFSSISCTRATSRCKSTADARPKVKIGEKSKLGSIEFKLEMPKQTWMPFN